MFWVRYVRSVAMYSYDTTAGYRSLVENNIYLMFSLSFPLDEVQPYIFLFQVRGQLAK